jgi:predicted nuclease of predicted toxin-antitoxin system
MPWRPLQNPTEALGDDLKKKTRILVDESLGRAIGERLQEEGYNAVFVNDVGLSGHSDEDIFAYAWREKRMLWTHDRDFLDDARFPRHRNPGLVILPGGDGDNRAMEVGVRTALAIFGHGPALWSKTKSIVSPTGEMTIRRRNHVSRYRMRKGRYAEEWRSE